MRNDAILPPTLSSDRTLVKWWLLAIPHYLIVGILVDGLYWWATDFEGVGIIFLAGGGLILLLVLIALIALAFTGRYRQDLFELIMGFNRWAYRVYAYAALMRDEYPPFRLDLGGREPGAGVEQNEVSEEK